jgi:hypothetical protein
MNGWAIFWAIWAIIAGVAFAVITIVVAIFGAGDVRRMFRNLASKNRLP